MIFLRTNVPFRDLSKQAYNNILIQNEKNRRKKRKRNSSRKFNTFFNHQKSQELYLVIMTLM